MTALPQPAKVNQKVPITSAAYFFEFISRVPIDIGVNAEAGAEDLVEGSFDILTGRRPEVNRRQVKIASDLRHTR